MSSDVNLGAIGTGGPFTGFPLEDFEAFDRKKWSSNAFNLQRRQAKDHLLALVKTVQSDLTEELGELEMGASDEAPTVSNSRQVKAQWVFFTRDAPTRAGLKPLLSRMDLNSSTTLFDISIQHQHACLSLRIDQAGFAISVELGTKAKVDRDNVQTKLEHKWARDRLIELTRALPGGSIIGFEGETEDVFQLTEERIQTWKEGLSEAHKAFIVECPISRDEESLATELFIGTATEYVASLLPIYRFLAWSRDNDHSQLKVAIQKEKKAQKEKSSKKDSLQPGSRVTILSGLFAGRGGYLAEIGSKGKAKVMVGPVSVTVDVKDLKAN